MPKRVIEVGSDRPLLDIASYARPGPRRRDRLSAAEIEHISLTVHRAPEVMVKVLSRGGQDLSAIRRHTGYIGRHGDLEIETDDGRALKGRGVGKDLLEDWDLDLDEHRRHCDLAAADRRQSPKLVHKLILSMPPGTPANKLLASVREFAREQFALKHRYAMVLHTDEPHPHVHMLIKAVSEQGVRLNIRKETLRGWRKEFARHLRRQGVPANATERAVRGVTTPRKLDGIYRAMRDPKRDSTHIRGRVDSVAADILSGTVRVEPGKATLLGTRINVERGWRAVADALLRDGEADLAARAKSFVDHIPTPMTEREWLAGQLRSEVKSTAIWKEPTVR